MVKSHNGHIKIVLKVIFKFIVRLKYHFDFINPIIYYNFSPLVRYSVNRYVHDIVDMIVLLFENERTRNVFIGILSQSSVERWVSHQGQVVIIVEDPRTILLLRVQGGSGWISLSRKIVLKGRLNIRVIPHSSWKRDYCKIILKVYI